MKYNHNRTIHKQWNEGHVKWYMKCIQSTVVETALPNKNCGIGHFNLLKNSGKIEGDQLHYTDYPECAR